MSTVPRFAALERRQTNLEVRVEEITEDMTANFKHLSNDMTASFKQVSEYFRTIEATMATKDDLAAIDARFEKIDARFEKIDARFEKIDARFEKIETDIAEMKATMATKDDLAAVETRILDAFKQVLAVVYPQHPQAE